MKPNKILILISCLLSLQLIAQNKVSEIDKLVTYSEHHDMFSGNILVAEKGEIIYHKAIGMSDVKNEVPLNLNSSFCVGSIAKQFTAFSIMLLVDMGKLNYNDKVGDIFPELPAHMHPITLINLMQHTSGLKRTHYGSPDGLTNEDIYNNLVNAKDDKLLFPPGTDFSYSNSGYMLLAMIVEKASGKSFEAFLTENVWRPLGMTNTYVMSKEDYGRHNKVVGYDGYGNVSDFNVLTYGSNGIYSTTEDLFRWTQSFSTDKLMDFKIKSKAWKRAVSSNGEVLQDGFKQHQWNYGLGYFIYNNELDGVVGHTGLYGGFFSFMMHDFKNNRDIVILTNNSTIIPLHDVHVSIQNILNDKPFEYPPISIERVLWKDYYNNVDKAILHYHKLKTESPKKYKFDWPRELNNLGYRLIGDKRYSDAVKIMELFVEEFPNQSNSYDSLGEAYHLNGQYKKSTQSYRKALKINPNYNNAEYAKMMIKKNKTSK